MKGVIFNALQEFVEQGYGYQAWDDALTACNTQSDGVFVATKSYDDSEILALVSYFSSQLSMPADDLLRAFGEGLFNHLYQRAPELIKCAQTLREFLISVDEIIHAEVRKLYQDPNLPEFDYDESQESHLIMIYHSARKLCFLSEGLIFGAAKQYQQAVKVSQPVCMHQGGDCCHLYVEFVDGDN